MQHSVVTVIISNDGNRHGRNHAGSFGYVSEKTLFDGVNVHVVVKMGPLGEPFIALLAGERVATREERSFGVFNDRL